jgi:hypothetical protein
VGKAGRPAVRESPYRAIEEGMVANFEEWIAAAPDARPVADAIVAAADGAAGGPVHVLVGEAAEYWVGQYRSLSEHDYRAIAGSFYLG